MLSTSARSWRTARLTIRLSIRPWSIASSAAMTYRARVMRRTLRRSSNWMPTPGTTSIPDTMSARRSSPLARSSTVVSSAVAPVGSWPPITPRKMMSVASPSRRGPITVSVTLTAHRPTTRPRPRRSGRSWATRRRNDERKCTAFSVGAAMLANGPRRCDVSGRVRQPRRRRRADERSPLTLLSSGAAPPDPITVASAGAPRRSLRSLTPPRLTATRRSRRTSGTWRAARRGGRRRRPRRPRARRSGRRR